MVNDNTLPKLFNVYGGTTSPLGVKFTLNRVCFKELEGDPGSEGIKRLNYCLKRTRTKLNKLLFPRSQHYNKEVQNILGPEIEELYFSIRCFWDGDVLKLIDIYSNERELCEKYWKNNFAKIPKPKKYKNELQAKKSILKPSIFSKIKSSPPKKGLDSVKYSIQRTRCIINVFSQLSDIEIRSNAYYNSEKELYNLMSIIQLFSKYYPNGLTQKFEKLELLQPIFNQIS